MPASRASPPTSASMPGETIAFKVDHRRHQLPLDIYRLGYYGGLGARFVDGRQALGGAAADPAGLSDRSHHRSGRLRQLGGVGVLGRARRTPRRASTSPSWCARTRRTGAPATSSSSCATTTARLSTALPDVGHDLAGVQPVRRQQLVRRLAGRPRLQGELQPPVHHRAARRPRTGSSTPSTRWCAGSRPTATTSATSPASTPTGAAPRSSSTTCTCRSGTTSTGRAAQRANVEAAGDAGVNLAFFSGNEVFWKTRWENSIDGSDTPYRTLVTYKETHANAKIDPLPNVWTGTWRDPRFSPPADGGRPENALTGTIFTVNCCSYAMTVPAADGKMRFWRNTSVATLPPAATATLSDDTLGYEWDEDLDNGFRPAGQIRLSTTTVSVPQRILDYGIQLRRRERRRTSDAAPPARRRARLRRRHRAVVVGPRRQSRPRQPARPTCACTRRRSTCSPTWARSRRRCNRAWSPPAHRPTTRPPTATITSPTNGPRRHAGSAGHDHRHGERFRRRRRRRRRGVGRRRRDLAPRQRTRELELHVGADRHRRRRASAAAPPTTAPISGRRRRR